ncbi:DNA-directed RNA polymerase subunit delta [Mycoplasma hafezii]|uniref:DNA-directed RNA polymerase subunit delta n=1 Tax=Mycoplasma hafezii TaxID=525886 RepID=UPI003CF79013
MKTKTMLEIAIAKISENTAKSYTFDELFDAVESELKDKWVHDLGSKYEDLPEEEAYEKIRTKKLGELYRLLTVDKRFTRNPDGTWISTTYEVFNK